MRKAQVFSDRGCFSLQNVSQKCMYGGENRLALRSYMLTCLNQHIAAVAEWSKAVLRLRIAATSIPVYITGWCGHGFDSQPFLLTYSEADLTYYF